MMKHFTSLMAIFVLTMVMASGGVLAFSFTQGQTYTNATLVLSGSYVDPQIACISDADCVLVTYNNATGHLWLYHTKDGFASWNVTVDMGSPTWWSGSHPLYPEVQNYHYGYDVIAVGSDDYRVAYLNKMYSFYPSNTSLVLLWQCGSDATGTCGDCGGAGGGNEEDVFLGFVNESYVAGFCISNRGGSSDPNTINYAQYNVNNGNIVYQGSNIMSALGGSCNGYYPACMDVVGVVFRDSYKYKAFFEYYCGGAGVCTWRDDGTSTSIGSFPDGSYDGLWYWGDNDYYVYYRNSTFLKRVSTTDWSSFGSAQNVQEFNWTTHNDTISREDRASFSGFDYVAFEAQNGSDSGIWMFNTWEAPDYSPPEEFTSGSLVIAGNPLLWWTGQQALAPKVSCDEDMQECVMLFWDTGIFGFGRALYIIYSVDGFETPVSYPIGNPYTFTWGAVPNADYINEFADTDLDYYDVGYDVKYNPIDGKFYIIALKNTTGAIIYDFSIGGGLNQVADLSTCSSYYYCWRKAVGLEYKETGIPYAIVLENNGGIAGSTSCDISYKRFWLFNGTSDGSMYSTTESCGGFCFSGGITSAGGFIDDYGEYNVQFQGSCNTQNYDKFYTSSDISSYFPSDYLGMNYYRENNNLVYTREGNATVNEGQWRTTTDDFVSYSTPVLYYAWDKLNAESIPRVDSTLLNNYRLHAYERQHATSPGIYSYRESLFPVYLFARYEDPLTGEPDIPVNVSAMLVCPSNYTTSGTGSDVNLYSTCDSAMWLQIYASGFYPAFGNITFDKIAGCDSAMFVRANYLPSSYTVNLTVRDQETGLPIPGASVTIGASHYTTDSYGKALVTVQPVLNAEFVHYTDSGSCTEYLQVNGTAKTYYISLTASGYRATSYYNYQFVEQETTGGINYFTFKDEDALVLYMSSGADVTVRVYNFDGVPVSENLVSVEASGADSIYVMIDDVPVAVDTATEFPAVFRLVDDSSSYVATFNLTIGDYYEVKTKTIVDTTNYYTLSFTLPENESYQCVTVNDCSPSYCQGTFHYILDSCTGGSCIYDVEACTLCDDDIGCYEDSTSTSCFFDTDCTDTCLNSAYLTESSCGSGNTCLEHVVECTSGCVDVDEGEDYCAEAPPSAGLCDQSTVTGMLGCMQSGVMAFVGSVYDPAFVIFLVLFLVIIIGTVIVLAIKGVENVIR